MSAFFYLCLCEEPHDRNRRHKSALQVLHLLLPADRDDRLPSAPASAPFALWHRPLLEVVAPHLGQDSGRPSPENRVHFLSALRKTIHCIDASMHRMRCMDCRCSFFFLYSLLAAHGIALTLGCVLPLRKLLALGEPVLVELNRESFLCRGLIFKILAQCT